MSVFSCNKLLREEGFYINENVIKLIGNEMIKYLNNFQMSKLNEVLYKTIDFDYSDDLSNKEYLERFLNAKKLEGISNKTLINYKRYVIKMFDSINKDVRIIDANDIRTFLTDYQNTTGCINSSMENIRCSLASFFSWLEREDYILKSPIKKIHKIKSDIKIKEIYSDEAIEKLRNICSNRRDLAIIDLLISSGIRVSELVHINISDLNFDNCSCKVFGKGNKEREVYFDAKTKLHIQEYLSDRTDEELALFISNIKPHKRIGTRAVEMMLHKLATKVGLKGVYPHKFRRTLATKAIDKGMPIEQVQKLLGHTKIDTTLHYAQVSQSNVKISHRGYIC